jgi:membrane-associated protease RseP (regulator of RpoE activity)
VRSFGLLLASIFPIGAFTEPDEKELERVNEKSQLKVYSAGASFNLCLGLIVFLLMGIFGYAFSGYITQMNKDTTEGIYITSFSEYTGLCNDGVKSLNFGLYDNNIKIIAMNGLAIKDMNDFAFAQKQALDNNQFYITYTFEKDENIFDGNLYFNSDKKFGMSVYIQPKSNISFFYSIMLFIISFANWLMFLNFMVALANFIPSEPFDGGKMAKIILSRFIFRGLPKLKQKYLIGVLTGLIIIILVIINVLPFFF